MSELASESSAQSLRWALIGASDIAATRMIPAMRALGHDVAVVCSADAERARAWAQSQNIAHGTDSLDDALSVVESPDLVPALLQLLQSTLD